MPNPVDPIKNLAKFLAKSKEKGRMYHITDAPEDFSVFRPANIHRQGIFVSPDTEFTNAFKALDESSDVLKYAANTRTMPVYVNVKNPFDYENPNHLKNLQKQYKKETTKSIDPNWLEEMKLGDWESLENPQITRAIKNLGHDAYYVSEGYGIPAKNLAVFEPTQVKSAIGNRGTFDPTNPDITKAKGGQVNPFKSPREMLFEMAGIPAMAGGGKPAMASEMYKLVTQAIERYTQKFGRAPSPEDVQALKQHAKELSQKAEIKTDPATQARARHEMATDPNLINPEGPDPFLTKAMTGRTVKGTYIKPKVQDINDPNVRANIETKQIAGELEDIMPESITPSADYFGRTSKAIENEALASGSPPMIDKLKAAFFAKNKRYPTDEELEIIIAEFNPSRHQYGTMGDLVVGERPPTASGMAEWKQKARTEGVPEVYLEESPRKYPKYLQDALNLSRGVQPGTKPLSNARINPDRSYADGSAVAAMTPREMQAAMVARNKTPSKLMPETRMEKIMRGASIPFAALSAQTAGQRLAEGDPYEAALYGTSALGSGMAATRKYMRPGLGIAGGASVPLSIDDAIKRYKMGDRTGAVIATIEAAGNAAAMFPPTAIPGSVIGFGAGVANAIRGEPEYRSVMEENR